MSKTITISSENLVTNRRHRGKWGAKVDSMEEALVVIRNGLEKMVDDGRCGEGEGSAVGPFEDPLPTIGEDCRSPDREVTSETVQLTVKLFLRENDRATAVRAINTVKKMLNTERIHNLYVTVPATDVSKIGMTVHSETEETSEASESESSATDQSILEENGDVELNDPEREKFAGDLASLWNELTQVGGIEALGLCDVETDVFKRIYTMVNTKPKNVQVNLKSCCVVPPALKQFAAAKKIKLLTHSDSPEILGDKFCHGVSKMVPEGGRNGGGKWRPLWIVRFQIFKHMRGQLVDRRYIVALDRS